MGLLAALPIIGNIMDPVGRIGELLSKAYLEQQNAANESERIKADTKVKMLEARQQVVIRDPYGPLVRLGFALPFVIYNAKLVLWDKVLEWGVTDGLSIELMTTQTAIISFYFVYSIVDRFKS